MAAKKKDFSAIDTGINTGRVHKTIEQATSSKGQQGTAGPQEQAERAAELRTQGRKGCKAIRINMAFTPDNHTFIRVLSKATGRTMTQLTNDVITAYRNEHPKFLEQANNFLNFVNSGRFSLIDGGTGGGNE